MYINYIIGFLGRREKERKVMDLYKQEKD